jgi:hypothetical protein
VASPLDHEHVEELRHREDDGERLHGPLPISPRKVSVSTQAMSDESSENKNE